MKMKTAIFSNWTLNWWRIITIDLLRRVKIIVDIVSLERKLAVISSHYVKINCKNLLIKSILNNIRC